MDKLQSVAPAEIAGVCVISGLWGVGKTTLAMTCENPQLTAMLDLDQKSRARAELLGVEYYSPADLGLDEPLEYDLAKVVEWFRATLSQLPEGKTTLIIDNGSPLEEAFGEVVRQDPQRYGVKPANVESGRFGGVNPGVGKLWESVVSFLNKKGYTRIFIVMHMSQNWTNAGPVPNKYKVKGNKTLSQLSNLSLILMRSAVPNAAPVALVAKEALGVIKYKEGTFRVTQALPPRIPLCDWGAIKDYISTAGERTAYKDDEIPTAFEMSCYGQFMTPEQVAFIRAVAENPSFQLTEEEVGEETKEPAEDAPPPIPGARPVTYQTQKPESNGDLDWKGFQVWIVEQGWDVAECRTLLKEKFGSSWRSERTAAYKEHLHGFHGTKEVAG